MVGCSWQLGIEENTRNDKLFYYAQTERQVFGLESEIYTFSGL
jgi:hypothetical protein